MKVISRRVPAAPTRVRSARPPPYSRNSKGIRLIRDPCTGEMIEVPVKPQGGRRKAVT